MKKFSQSFVYWSLCVLCCIGIVKTLSISKLYSLSPSLDIHVRDDSLEAEYKRLCERDAEERKK